MNDPIISVSELTNQNQRRGNYMKQRIAAVMAAVLGLSWVALMSMPAGAAFPGTNGKIMYTAALTRTGRTKLFTARADGSNPTAVRGRNQQDASWAPDGSKFVYVHFDRAGHGDLFVRNSNGAGKTRLTNTKANEGDPSFSPGGNRVVFHRSGGNGYDIWTIGINGRRARRLTASKADDLHPSWSVFGRIAFGRSPQRGDGEIFAMKANGENLTRLTDNRDHDGEPSWSPDGESLTFTRCPVQYNCDVFTMSGDGGGDRQLTNSLKPDGGSTYSPDGNKILFVRARSEGESDLFVVSAEGSTTAVRLTNTPRVGEFEPEWQPR